MIKPKILVTGGCGYIGSHTVVELIQNNFDVFIIDNLCNSNINVLSAINKITGTTPEFLNMDLRDIDKLDFVFNLHKFDGVIHFAALKSVEESTKYPILYYDNNVVSTLNLLKIMKKYNVDNLVFSSSCTVYGNPDKLPVTEDTPIGKCSSPYGTTKKMCEDIINDTDIKSISLRYFNPAGAHHSSFIGENPNGIPSNLIPYITQTVVGKLNQLSVYGDDYDTPDGSCIRDFIHVEDLAKAHVVSVKRLLSNKNIQLHESYNIGTGKGTSVFEIIRETEKIINNKLNFILADRRDGDIEQIYADTTFANNVLGWKSEKTIIDILESAIKWEFILRPN